MLVYYFELTFKYIILKVENLPQHQYIVVLSQHI